MALDAAAAAAAATAFVNSMGSRITVPRQPVIEDWTKLFQAVFDAIKTNAVVNVAAGAAVGPGTFVDGGTNPVTGAGVVTGTSTGTIT